MSWARLVPPRRLTGNSFHRPTEIRRGDQGESLGIEALVAAARRAAEGRAQRAADHDGRRRLRRAGHLRRRHPDAGAGPHRRRAGCVTRNFHSTALCSPTRAALITGRNHHSAGFGVVGEIATGFPGYNSVIRKDKAHHRPILKENGYATSWFGKDHNTPFFRRARPGRSTNGRSAWASNTSTASSAATPASGSRTCSATPRRSIPSTAIPAGT